MERKPQILLLIGILVIKINSVSSKTFLISSNRSMPGPGLNFAEADNWCRERSGRLAVITSQEEKDEFQDLFLTTPCKSLKSVVVVYF